MYVLEPAVETPAAPALFAGWRAFPAAGAGHVVTIGNFDGVHLGHRDLLREAVQRASDLGLPSVLVTFEPLTPEYFAGAHPPARLSTLREKLSALSGSGLDRVLALRFDASLAGVEAGDFIDRILVQGLGARHLVIGDDFRFGHRGAGDRSTLEAAGARGGFTVAERGTVVRSGARVSSTRVRAELAAGRLEAAAALLGRPYSMRGRVGRGARLGRTIGYPTANIATRRRAWPLSGVFAVRVHGVGPDPWPGMANLGLRPTVGGQRMHFEVNLFDFSGDLYGREIEVEFATRLRGEQRFESVDALREQLGRDAAQARAALAGQGARPGGREPPSATSNTAT